MGLPVIRLIYSESKQCGSQRPVFPYADFFRSYTSLRGNAPGITESGGYFAFDKGDKAAESFIVRAADGSVWIPIAVMAAFMVICGGIAIRFFKWE